MQKRRTFWIADQVGSSHRDRALLLQDKGFEVQFFTSLDAVAHELEVRRASIIIVSDDGNEAVTERFLLGLMLMPEVQGARLILVSSKRSERLSMLAACTNFRDVIPLEIDNKQWLQRFIFATASRRMTFVQPAGQISLNNISAVHLPTRLTSVSPTRLRIECRLHAPVDATLNLSGAFAEALGIPSVTLKVVETQRSYLQHRFSDAIVCDWSVPTAAKPRIEQLLRALREQDPGPRCRIFVAVKSTTVRHAILSRFDEPSFEISTALQKHSIVEEPRFFTPDVVFIEDTLCIGEEEPRFAQMLQNLMEHVTIVVIGGADATKELQRRYPQRRIVVLQSIPRNLSQSVLARYLPLHKQTAVSERDVCHVVAEHPYSLAEISFPARLHHLHPLVAQIAMPYPVGNFALLRLESPVLRKMLRRNPMVKLTATYQDTHPDAGTFVHLADCHLSDLDHVEQQTVASGLTRLVSNALQRFDMQLSGIGHSGPVDKSVRTPELGSVKEQLIPVIAKSQSPFAHLQPSARQVSGELGLGLAASNQTGPAFEEESLAAFAHAERAAALAAASQRGALSAAMTAVAATGSATAGRKEDLQTALKASPRHPPHSIESVPVVMEMAQAAQELKDDVLKGVREGLRHEGFLLTLKFIAFVAFVTTILWGVVTVLQPHWSTSGGVYSEQLKKFAPKHGRE